MGSTHSPLAGPLSASKEPPWPTAGAGRGRGPVQTARGRHTRQGSVRLAPGDEEEPAQQPLQVGARERPTWWAGSGGVLGARHELRRGRDRDPRGRPLGGRRPRTKCPRPIGTVELFHRCAACPIWGPPQPPGRCPCSLASPRDPPTLPGRVGERAGSGPPRAIWGAEPGGGHGRTEGPTRVWRIGALGPWQGPGRRGKEAVTPLQLPSESPAGSAIPAPAVT